MSDLDSIAALLFPGADYRIQMNLRRGDPRAFLGPQDPSGALLRYRRQLCLESPDRYTALLPEGMPALRSFGTYCLDLGLPVAEEVTGLGCLHESDLLFMVRRPDGVHALAGGALCFPSGWSLREKLGRDLLDIHGIVPGLNPAVGAAITTFLARLGPGIAFERANWGLAGSPELNRHPDAHPPGFVDNPGLRDLWLRVEHQLLLGLAEPGSLLFAIRIEHVPLEAVAGHARCREGLSRALSTMPADLAAYKGLASIRDGLLTRLGRC